MREEIEAEGGTVEKFIGDAVMVAFGVPLAHEDDASRALRAGLRMLARLPEVNRELETAHGVGLQIRIGVHTGEVLATVGAAPGDAMVIGDAVNAAARLQTAAEPGELLASERTIRSARWFEAVDRGPLELKGKRERVRAFAVTGESGGPTRGLPGLHAPMVGRDAELDLLRSVFERTVHERRPHLIDDLRRRGRREVAAHARVPRVGRGAPAALRRSSPAGVCPTATASPTGRSPRS